MSEECKWLHEALEELPLIKYPFELESLPLRGIYFFYEEGEIWGHGGEKLRIVRIGTHRGNNFRNRIAEHFLIDERKMNFDRGNPKPSDRSIFRKNIGRALLNKDNDTYLSVWNKDFTRIANRDNYGDLRNIEKEKSIESQITEILRKKFFFKFIIVEDENERIGREGFESKFIGTVSRCTMCRPSVNWIGNYSPIEQIRTSGLWLIQHLNAEGITEEDMPVIEELIRNTQTRIDSGKMIQHLLYRKDSREALASLVSMFDFGKNKTESTVNILSTMLLNTENDVKNLEANLLYLKNIVEPLLDLEDGYNYLSE